ncbi:S1 family peptidase [Zooshikella ganghwensis]|uniref:S1 family peptidase n=1 Tax=Zooshikella ganghwensis TaxID=202772 RepID=UPI0004102753|nr:serine protease [Zooshikella ganghwensis]
MVDFDVIFKTNKLGDLDDYISNICLITKQKKCGWFHQHSDATQRDLSWMNNFNVQANFTESGTGLFVSQNQIITAAHVFEDAKKIDKKNKEYINIYNNNVHYEGYIEETINDFCLIKTTKKNQIKNSPPFRINCTKAKQIIKLNKKVYCMGYPYSSRDLRFTEGKILENFSENNLTVQTTLPAVVGLSGSPVFAYDDNNILWVIGVISFGPAEEATIFNNQDQTRSQISPSLV